MELEWGFWKVVAVEGGQCTYPDNDDGCLVVSAGERRVPLDKAGMLV